MAAFTQTTDVHTVIGTFKNGRKLVYSSIPVESVGATITQVAILPLKRIISFIPTFTTNTANVNVAIFAAGTAANEVGITLTGGCNGAVIGILSVGV